MAPPCRAGVGAAGLHARGGGARLGRVCRNIRPLFNFAPPVTDDEIRAAALQYVRKISGFVKPSTANEAAFLAAVDQVALASTTLLAALETRAPAKTREAEAAKAKLRFARRGGR